VALNACRAGRIALPALAQTNARNAQFPRHTFQEESACLAVWTAKNAHQQTFVQNVHLRITYSFLAARASLVLLTASIVQTLVHAKDAMKDFIQREEFVNHAASIARPATDPSPAPNA
jgi:hypothetical protein